MESDTVLLTPRENYERKATSRAVHGVFEVEICEYNLHQWKYITTEDGVQWAMCISPKCRQVVRIK